MRLWLHLAKLRWNLRIIQLNRNIIFQTSIGGFKMFFFQGTCKLYYHIPQVQYDFSVSWTHFIWAAHPIRTILGSKSFCYVTLMYLAGPTAVTFLAKSKVGEKKQHIYMQVVVSNILLECSPIYLGSPTEDMMSEFTLFTTICHWTCPTLEDDFVSVLFFFCVSLKKIARSCRLLIMSDNMQLQLALFNAQRGVLIWFGQIIPYPPL